MTYEQIIEIVKQRREGREAANRLRREGVQLFAVIVQPVEGYDLPYYVSEETPDVDAEWQDKDDE